MDLLLVLLRLVHVVLGAVWVGMVFYMVVFLAPAVRDAGPEGGKVMAALQRRGVMTALPIIALATILSGLWLFWRASFGLQPAYLLSRGGLAFGLGGVASIVAFALGFTVMRPAMLRAGALAQTLASTEDAREREAAAAEIQRLRTRGTVTSQLVAVLILGAVAAMAIARYL